MRNEEGFDLWADDYDKYVNLSEDAGTYPFAGYRNVLNTIYGKIKSGNGKKVLDIGFGTGTLTKKLYNDGYEIYGIDFSEKMISAAQSAMPAARLIKYDFSLGLPAALDGVTFDYIVCTYAIHHLDDRRKNEFLTELLARLSPGGGIFIGDVAFATRDDLEHCKTESSGTWDNDEHYTVCDTVKTAHPTACFEKISFCAGVLTLRP